MKSGAHCRKEHTILKPVTRERADGPTLFDPVCKGCGRTQQEVDNWVFMTKEERQAAVDRAAKEGSAMRFKR